MNLKVALFVTIVVASLPLHAATTCKGQIVVEWANQKPDPVVSDMLNKAEQKATKDGYCVTHFDLYNSLGHINLQEQIDLAARLKNVPVAVYEFRSVPVTNQRSIIISQTRWCPIGYSPFEMSMLDHSVKVYDFAVEQFSAEELNYGEPSGFAGWANNLENSYDVFNAMFGVKR